jgi:two-component system response regulator RpfG
MTEEFFELKGLVDEEVLDDFMESLYETLELIEHDLSVLELSPDNEETIHKVFRSLHTLKGNARMALLEPFSDFMHALEEAFSDVRARRTRFNLELKELFLLSLDQFRLSAERMVQMNNIETAPIHKLVDALLQVNQTPPEALPAYLKTLLQSLGGKLSEHIGASAKVVTLHSMSGRKAYAPEGKENNKDLLFFSQLSRLIDGKSPFWENRTEQILDNASLINEELEHLVAPSDLAAAVYLHDVGMMFISDYVLNKEDRLNALEEKLIRKHPNLSYEWVVRMSGWEKAADIVLHHHERVDGKGYPKGLLGADICLGAKIIAVADTFFSITNERADRTYKRSLVRAIKEINAYVGAQFDEKVVDAFNEVVRQKLVQLKE